MTFPTRVKAKISSKLSYPLGAELISSELAGVPQARILEINFHAKYERMETRGMPYSILKFSYSGPAGSYHPRSIPWSIEVRPVPRALKHTVKESIVRDFFPRIRQWLEKHAGLTSTHGSHSLSVVFDGNCETLLKLQEFHSREAN